MKENAIYLAQGYNYDNFGKEEELKSESSFKNDVTFTGAVSDSMTGLYYMNARHYDPDTGRFLQQDTYKGSAAVPWTQHLYVYTGNNPVNMVDPTGHYTNTASDQYANYTYDWSSKTLVPIVNYSNTMTDQYQGDYGKIHSTISKNGIQRRRTNMPKSSTNSRSDVVSELRKEAISGQNYERLANDYSAIRTYASDGIGYMSADEAAQAWADRFAKQSYYNEKSSIIYSLTDPRNNETRYYYGVTYEGNQYDTIPGTIIGYIDERAKSFIYPMRKTVAHIHSHPYPGDGDWHNDVPSVTDEILPGLPGIEEAYLVPNKALCDNMPKIIKISDRDSWYPHRFKGWGY
ncbi:Cell wall-associated polypeptide CWBP200 [uncultured Clostridium sp.]|nr:Cell wall-associated polypeptide CWBP200 [uncultured Clostridium sp.]